MSWKRLFKTTLQKTALIAVAHFMDSLVTKLDEDPTVPLKKTSMLAETDKVSAQATD